MASIDDFLAWGSDDSAAAASADATAPSNDANVNANANGNGTNAAIAVHVQPTPDAIVAKAIKEEETTAAAAAPAATTTTTTTPHDDDEDSDMLRSLQHRHTSSSSSHPTKHNKHAHAHAHVHDHSRDSLSVPSSTVPSSLLDHQPLTAAELDDERKFILQQYHRANAAAANGAPTALDRSIDSALAAVKQLRAQLETEIANEHAYVEKQMKEYNDLRVKLEHKVHETRDLIHKLHTARAEKTTEVESLRARVAKAEEESAQLLAEVETVKRSLKEVKQRQTRRQQQQAKKKVALFPFLTNVSGPSSDDTGSSAATAAADGSNDDALADGRGVALPAAAVNAIFQSLLVREVSTCMRVCRSWQQAIEKNRVWLTLLERVTVQRRREKQRKFDELAALGNAQRGEFTRDSISDLADLAASVAAAAAASSTADDDEDVDDSRAGAGAGGSSSGSGSSNSSGGLFSRLRKKETPATAAAASPSAAGTGAGTPTSAASPSSAAATAAAFAHIDPRAPCPPHSHFALTIEMGPKDLYNVAVQSRVLRLEYECQSMRDSIDGGRTKAGMVAEKDKRRITVIVCELEPKQMTAELSFCQTTCNMHQTMSVAQADLKRLLEQMDADEEIKQQLRRELAEAKTLATTVEAENNTLRQQYSSDEVTKGFLADAYTELETRCIEEEEQTLQLEETQRREIEAKEAELRNIQSENERQQKQIAELREIKALLTNELKSLQSELDQATATRDQRRAQFERMSSLLQELASAC